MKTIRKFFDKDGREVEPKDADKCHELIADEDGNVVNDAWYFVEDKK